MNMPPVLSPLPSTSLESEDDDKDVLAPQIAPVLAVDTDGNAETRGYAPVRRAITSVDGVLAFGLPFKARTLTVDNPSGRWLFIPACGQYVEPGTMGNTYVLEPTNIAEIIDRAPSGFAQIDTVLSTGTIATWYDALFPPTPGRKIIAKAGGAGAQFQLTT